MLFRSQIQLLLILNGDLRHFSELVTDVLKLFAEVHLDEGLFLLKSSDRSIFGFNIFLEVSNHATQLFCTSFINRSICWKSVKRGNTCQRSTCTRPVVVCGDGCSDGSCLCCVARLQSRPTQISLKSCDLFPQHAVVILLCIKTGILSILDFREEKLVLFLRFGQLF